MRWIPYAFVTIVFTTIALAALSFLARHTIHDPNGYIILAFFCVIPFLAILFLLTLYSKDFDQWVAYFKAWETTEPATHVETETKTPKVQQSGMTDVAETIARELGKK
jgi:hypothetical protein